jgi:hypothetical protein
LDPVDFGGRDIAFLEQAEDASAKGESICVSVSEDSVKRMIYFESAAPMADLKWTLTVQAQQTLGYLDGRVILIVWSLTRA